MKKYLIKKMKDENKKEYYLKGTCDICKSDLIVLRIENHKDLYGCSKCSRSFIEGSIAIKDIKWVKIKGDSV